MEVMCTNKLLTALVQFFYGLLDCFSLLSKVRERTNVRVLSWLDKLTHLKSGRDSSEAVVSDFGLLKGLFEI